MKLLVASLVLVAVAAQELQNWVPGICGAGSLNPTIGVGCGILGTDLQVYAPPDASQYRIKPLIQNTPCEFKCYTPGHETDPDCQYCVYVNPLYPNNSYKVPKNVFVTEWTGSSSCFEQSTLDSWDDVAHASASVHGHSGYFSWSSTVTENFMNRYFRDYASQSLFVQRYVYSSIVLFPSQTLDTDFQIRVSLLPTQFNASTQATFFEFIEAYGTHYIDSAFMGGVAVLTSFFQSCMVSTFSGQYIYHESGSSFFGIFNHDHKHAQGYNHTTKLFYEYSNSTVNLYGGDGNKWGDFNWTNPVTANYSEAWADTLYSSQVPVIFSLRPLPYLIPSQYNAQALALNASIQAYFDSVRDANEQKAKAYGPRKKQVPSWCHDSPAAQHLRSMGAEGERMAAEAARAVEEQLEAARADEHLLTDDAGPAPPPLPQCPNMLDLLEKQKRRAEEIELERELGMQ